MFIALQGCDLSCHGNLCRSYTAFTMPDRGHTKDRNANLMHVLASTNCLFVSLLYKWSTAYIYIEFSNISVSDFADLFSLRVSRNAIQVFVSLFTNGCKSFLSFRVFDCEFTVTAIKVESRALSSSFFFVCVCVRGQG